MYKSIIEIKEANARYGGHWFAPANMRFFNCRISSEVIRGRYFISSERYENEPRLYTVRSCDPDGQIQTVGEFQAHKSIAAARKWLQANHAALDALTAGVLA